MYLQLRLSTAQMVLNGGSTAQIVPLGRSIGQMVQAGGSTAQIVFTDGLLLIMKDILNPTQHCVTSAD